MARCASAAGAVRLCCWFDMSDCFGSSNPDFSSVSETEEKHKTASGSLDQDLRVWDIQITRRTLIESRTHPLGFPETVLEACKS
jgi:hypothetical protein